ncbi:30S ribosomal protein S9 [Tichowtungia aerotolerans]|uniref:Small ribosomal subunit protein uS9 n=1 Tax=Tichowtungia aerotolerans TaxID=2697043 RepID=A0A6P1M678_9BACT|nr:30S ribosomal protein S9 [Tichowtungia aerotolerans]QHI70080.1 30S ribosomal protein S9 [Tichowtungia aerotolerans]
MAIAKKIDEFAATGRRKTSVARVRLVKGAGTITVNGQDVKEYFDTKDMIDTVSRPLVLTDRAGQYDLKISVKGGGKVGQSGAIAHGLSRALVIAEEDLKGTLKKAGLLTRDARMKERKKAGQPGARKKFQFSKR